MILVSGSLAYDRIMDFGGYFRDHILPEKLHVLSVSFMAKTFSENFGGTAGNIAYSLSLLQEKPTILAAAGSDFAPYQKWLKKNSIDISLIEFAKKITTASAYIITDQADNQITAFYPGAMKKKFKIQNSKFKSAIQNSKVSIAIVAAGNLEDMKTLPLFYRQNKISYIYDPGQALPALSGQDLIHGLTGAKVFICNDYELEMTLQKTKLSKKELLDKVDLLITTLGAEGSVIECKMKNGECRMYKIPSAKPKNTCDPTGAGDAYRAGLIKGLLMGLPLEKTGRLASVVSVYTVEKYGTQTHFFTWRELIERYKKNFKENLE